MMMKTAILSLLAALSVPFYASAQLTNYTADVTDSVWVNSSSSPIECRLDHVIPSFGVASFVSRSSKKINLDFHLDMYRINGATHQVSLRSVPPAWRPGRSVSEITELSFYQQFDGYVNDRSAWKMLSELERGFFPTFYFDDWYAGGSKTAVGLSSVNFSPKHYEFIRCVDGLLPYAFEDIAFTVLNYQSNSDELTPRSKQRLSLIEAYVRHDPEIQLILLDGHTDSFGSRSVNERISEKRANAVKDYFVSAGLEANDIQVNGHGERRLVAGNDTPLERNKNRRVVISLGKDYL